MLNIKGLAQTVLTWEGKVFAAADADAAETNWKHKVTPDRGDLINQHWLRWWPYRQQAIIWTNDGLFYWHIYASLGLNGLSNYANPVYCVSTICHQVRCLRWGHPCLFHTATYLFIWYKMFRMGDISYRLIWMKYINMLSVYAQSGTHRRFHWWIIGVLT